MPEVAAAVVKQAVTNASAASHGRGVRDGSGYPDFLYPLGDPFGFTLTEIAVMPPPEFGKSIERAPASFEQP